MPLPGGSGSAGTTGSPAAYGWSFPKRARSHRRAHLRSGPRGGLSHGWIDGQAQRRDDASYRLRFTPRQRRSDWSKRNTVIAERLMDEGRMHLKRAQSREPSFPPLLAQGSRSYTKGPGWFVDQAVSKPIDVAAAACRSSRVTSTTDSPAASSVAEVETTARWIASSVRTLCSVTSRYASGKTASGSSLNNTIGPSWLQSASKRSKNNRGLRNRPALAATDTAFANSSRVSSEETTASLPSSRRALSSACSGSCAK